LTGDPTAGVCEVDQFVFTKYYYTAIIQFSNALESKPLPAWSESGYGW